MRVCAAVAAMVLGAGLCAPALRAENAADPTLVAAHTPPRVKITNASAAALDARQLRLAPPASQVYASRHYLVHTDLPRDRAQPIGRTLDAIYDEYTRRFAGFGDADPQRMTVYLFRTRDAYLSFLADQGIRAQHSGGMFFVNPMHQGLATWTDGRAPGELDAVLRHEGFHQFAWTHLGRSLPLWANEGVAQYFEDAPLVNGRLATGALDPFRLRRVQQALRDRTALPLGTLMAQSESAWGDALHRHADHSGLLYAQSWSLVYFLIHGDDGRHRAAFIDFLRRCGRGESADAAFARAFGGLTPEGLQPRWVRYVASLEPTALDTAEERMAFLAEGLKLYAEHDWPMPAALPALRDHLRQINFAMVQQDARTSFTLSSADDANFAFDRPGRVRSSFVLLEPARADLPPRITAPGLSPEPTLVWSRAADGKLTHAMEYR